MKPVSPRRLVNIFLSFRASVIINKPEEGSHRHSSYKITETPIKYSDDHQLRFRLIKLTTENDNTHKYFRKSFVGGVYASTLDLTNVWYTLHINWQTLAARTVPAELGRQMTLISKRVIRHNSLCVLPVSCRFSCRAFNCYRTRVSSQSIQHSSSSRRHDQLVSLNLFHDRSECNKYGRVNPNQPRENTKLDWILISFIWFQLSIRK